MNPVNKTQYNQTRIWFLVILGVGACLLFTVVFFVFTISTSQPTAMKLFLPKDSEVAVEQNKVNPSGSLTLLLARNEVIYYYEGELAADGSNIKSSTLKEIRKVILDKKQSAGDQNLVVVIKPAEGASYKNTVDILDEMTINDVKRYAMVDISPAEVEIIKNK